jgi:hypothetical protein
MRPSEVGQGRVIPGIGAVSDRHHSVHADTVEHAGEITMKSITWASREFRMTQAHGTCWTRNQEPFWSWYQYSASYGMNAGCHPGIDVGMPLGTALHAPCDGVIVCAGTGKGTGEDSCAAYNYAGWGSPSGGGRVQIRRANGDMLILGHCKSSVVRPGQVVNKGDLVAHSGWEPAPHLHYEVRVPAPGQTTSGYRAVDPVPYLRQLEGEQSQPQPVPMFAQRTPFPFAFDGQDKTLPNGVTVYVVNRTVRARGGGKVRQQATLDSPEVREPLHRDEVFPVHYAFEHGGRWWYYTPFGSRILQEDCYELVRVEVSEAPRGVEAADRAKATGADEPGE